jgi:hypothetical protein
MVAYCDYTPTSEPSAVIHGQIVPLDQAAAAMADNAMKLAVGAATTSK